MTLTIDPLACAIIGTILVIMAATFWPIKGPSGSYDFGPQMIAFALWVCAIIAVLVIWLIYFIVT